MGPWRRAVISWINVLQLLPGDVSDFKEILGTQFFHNFLCDICGQEDDLDLSSPLNHTIFQFLKRQYPKFEVDGKALQHDETELLLVLSLLLFHSVMKGSEVMRGKMCRAFDDETQLVVKGFLERLVPSSEVLRKDDVRWAVREAEDGDSEGVSQTLFSTTPEPRKALHFFLHSPVTQQQKVVHEKYQEIRKLELKLGSETYEKNCLQEELLQSDNRLRQMSNKYEEKVKEVRKLKSVLMLQEADEGQQDSVQNVAKEQNYNLVIGKLKNKVTELEESTCALNQQNEELRKQVKVQSGDIVNLKLKLEEYLIESDRLEEELGVKSKQLDAVTERCHDLEKFLEEANVCDADPRHNLSALSFTGEVEDLARSVTDLMLCEEKERNKVLTEKVEELMLSLVDLENIKAHNSSLQEQLKTETKSRHTITYELHISKQTVKLLECRIADLESENATLLKLDHELKDVQETARKLHQANINLEAHSRLLTEQITKEQECMEKLRKEKMVQENTHYEQMRQMEEDKLVLEQEIETLRNENREEAEKLREISSRNEALQVQKESLEEMLAQEQKLLNGHKDKLKQLSCTIDELGDKRVKLEDKYLEAQLNVETLVKEKQDQSERLMSALGGLCKVLRQGVASLVEEQVSQQEPTSPDDAIVLVTELVDHLLDSVMARTVECESLKEKSGQFVQMASRMVEEKQVLEQKIDTLRSENLEEAEKLQEISSRNEALQVQKESLEEMLAQVQKLLNGHKDKLKQLSCTIDELGDKRVKLEDKYLEAQLNVETLVKEKQDQSERLMSALGGLCKVLRQGVASLVEEQVSQQEPTSPDDAIVLMTELVDHLLDSVTARTVECESLKEKSGQFVQMASRMVEEKQVLEQKIDTLRSENLEEAEKLQEISSRNEALQVQKESLEEMLAQEQKLLNGHKDKLKQLSCTIDELGDKRVKLEGKYLEAQLNVETLVKEKQDQSERLMSALGGLCKVLRQGVASLVKEQVSQQEPTSPDDAIVLATELVDHLLGSVRAITVECESLKEKCDQFVQMASRIKEEKLALEQQMETLRSENREEAEKLREISSRNEALQAQEQKLLNDHKDKLKQLSCTIDELGVKRVKLEDKYLEAQLNVETLVKEKQDQSERLMSELGGLCKVLRQGVSSLVEEQVSQQEPTSPDDAIVLATELVDHLLGSVTARTVECESLKEKCGQFVQMASRLVEEKQVLEQKIDTLRSENLEEAEKLQEISSRNEALQVQKESLEEMLAQEQKLLNGHKDKLKQLSCTIDGLGDKRVKLEGKYLEAQLNVETLVKEKQDQSERLMSALGGLCKVLRQGVASLVKEQVSQQEPTSPDDAIVLATELVDHLLGSVRAIAVECESLKEKCDQFVQMASRIEEEKLVLEQQMETLRSENREEAEKLREISSRNEALQAQEQKLLNDHKDKLKQLSCTINELGDKRVKLEDKYLEAQLNVETLVKEKQDQSERLMSALGGLCKVLRQGVASLVEEQVSQQEPTSPDDAIVLATELVDHLLGSVTARTVECESLKEKCDQFVQMASRINEEKLVLEQQMETLRSENREEAEKLREISSRNEALQAQEQKLLNDHKDKLKQLSCTIDELEDKYLKAQLNVETLVKEKQDQSERLMSALGGLCKVLRQGVASLVEEQVSQQEPTSPDDAIVLATELVDHLLGAVTVRTVECESLGVKCSNFRELLDKKTETDEALSEVLAALEASFSKHLVALGNGRGTPEAAWCMQSLEAVECCLAAVTGGGRKASADLRQVLRKVHLLEERPDAHECAASEAAMLRERFKAEYSSIQKQLEARQAQLSEARATFRSMREKMESEVLQRVEVVKEEYKGKLDSLKATMKEAYDAEVAKVKVGEAQLKAFAEELKARYRQLAREKQQVQEQLLRVRGQAECHDFVSDVAAATGGGGVTEETVTYVSRRRRSVRTSGMGRMFPEEDEQGEEFNNTYLADMKAGVCLPEDRLGELRYRNSLCPPHLQSSYPAETQFEDPSHFKDEDLMVGFPQDSARRKDRGYRKPGPPTPGKKGRPVVGEETPTPRRALKEANDVSGRSSSTPSRVKALFGLGRASRRDENVPTPRTKALGLFRRPHKRL